MGQLFLQKCKQLAMIVFKLLLKGLAQVVIPVAVKQKLEQRMLDLRWHHLPEQLAILPDRCVIGFHKATGVFGEILIEPVADSDAAFSKVTGIIRAEKILEVPASPPCIHCEWVQSAGTRTMCIDAAMIPVQKNAVLILACGVQQENREIRFQRHGVRVLRTDILRFEG